MDILRVIEKNLLNVANNNGKSNETDILKKNINEYFGYLADKASIESQKQQKYYDKYENARVVASMEYDKYVRDKGQLMNELRIEKSKSALHEYLKLKYTADVVPDIYTYQDIRLVDRVIIPRVPAKKAKKTKNAKPDKPAKPVKVPKEPKEPKEPKVKVDKEPTEPKPKPPKPPVECPAGKEINPLTGRCVNICKDDEVRNPETGKCDKINKKPVVAKKPKAAKAAKAAKAVALTIPEVPTEPSDPSDPSDPSEPSEPVDVPSDPTDPVSEPFEVPPAPPAKKKANAKVVECPKGKEINPLTGRCVNVCKEDEVRNPETGKCKKVKK
jgi:hypothetical protein